MEILHISDTALRARIEASISYLSYLYETSQQPDITDAVRTETYRMIVLYTISIIEAILFSIYESYPKQIHAAVYKFENELSEKYKHQDSHGRVVIAIK